MIAASLLGRYDEVTVIVALANGASYQGVFHESPANLLPDRSLRARMRAAAERVSGRPVVPRYTTVPADTVTLVDAEGDCWVDIDPRHIVSVTHAFDYRMRPVRSGEPVRA